MLVRVSLTKFTLTKAMFGLAFRKPRYHPAVTARPCAKYHTLANILSQLLELHPDFTTILDRVDAVVTLDKEGHRSNQWKMSRLNGDILRASNSLCVVPATASDEVYRAILIVKDELVPQLETALDNILHNHLLTQR
jgi:hypothetical protein